MCEVKNMKAEKDGIIFFGTPKEMAELFNLTEKEVRKQLKVKYYPQPIPMAYGEPFWSIIAPTTLQALADEFHK